MAKLSLTHEAPTPPEPGTGSVDISVNTQPTITAPAPVLLEAVNYSGLATIENSAAEYDGPMHEYQHVWTVRGSPLSASTVPENMIPSWNDPNVAYGRKVCMRFPDPGSYTVDLVVIDRLGNAATASTATITVVDPDTIYPGTQTICFSDDPAETWAGEKPGCQRVTVLSALSTALNGTAPRRLLFKRGETVIWNTKIGPGSSRRLDHVGAWGSGDKPILQAKAEVGDYWFQHFFDFTGTSPGGLTFENVDVRGIWDAETETGAFCQGPINNRMSGAHATMIYHCNFSGHDSVDLTCVQTDGTAQWGLMSDCYNTSWINFGVRSSGNSNFFVCAIWNRLTQKVEALSGPPHAGRNGLHNQHGPVRLLTCSGSYLAGNDLFTNDGWSGLSSNFGPGVADQPCLRWNTSGIRGSSNMVDRCVMEGGYRVILGAPATDTASVNEEPGNYLIDKALLIGTSRTLPNLIEMRFGSLTLKNVLGVCPDVSPYQTGGTPYVLVELAPQDVVPGLLDTIHRYYNNSLVSPMDRAIESAPIIWRHHRNAEYFFTDVIEENNVIHYPTTTPSSMADAPIDFATAVPGVTPRYRGVRFNFVAQNNLVLPSAIAVGGSWTIPYPSGTDQAYWQAREGAGDTFHMLDMTGQPPFYSFYFAAYGDFTVSYGASNITLTRLSSRVAAAWPSGNKYNLKLDRKSLIPARDYRFATPTHTLDFDAQTANFTNGEIITGGTSEAKGGIIRQTDNGATGTLTLHITEGTFQNDELITSPSGGSATVNGTATAVVSVPLARPTTGSAAIDGATSGRVALDDLLGTARGATPSRGALQET